MSAHANRPFARDQSSPTCLGRFAAWVSTKRQARRARRLEEETVACLNAMDSKLLNDIGMDITQVGDLSNELPNVIATNALTPSQRSNRRRRS